MDIRRFGRTAKGQAEIAQGGKTLRGKLRTVLFLIDANKPLVDIEQQVKLIGAPVDAIDQLVAGGYVAEIGAAGGAGGAIDAGAPVALAPASPSAQLTPEERVANFRVAKTFMNDTIVDALVNLRDAKGGREALDSVGYRGFVAPNPDVEAATIAWLGM